MRRVTVGALISWLVQRQRPPARLSAALGHRRDQGAVSRQRRSSLSSSWLAERRIHVKLDGHHPIGASHHQKVVVIDDCLAFCGGIDMTDKRWDTRAHDDDEPHRVGPTGEPYGPWHDATTALSGPVAKALGELCRLRWEHARAATRSIRRAASERLLARRSRCRLPRLRGRDLAHDAEDVGQRADVRDRAALSRSDRTRRTLDLRREPVFRVAQGRRGGRAPAGGSGRARRW